MQLKTKIFGTVIRENFLFFAAIALFFALLIRNSGIYPVVADETIYSTFSRLLPLADLTIPGYIYLLFYRLTNICGDGFHDCARILNATFFVAATPFIYLTTRQVCTKSAASIVALLALLGPINSYTAYFMPEALYFFSFWLLTWFILRLSNSSHLGSWCFAGILLGFSALVKPHALLIMPGLVAYILFASRKKEGAWVLQALRNAGVFVAFTFVFKFLLSYLIAGKAGMTIFGTFYISQADHLLSKFQYIQLFTLSMESVKGHLLVVCLMFGVPTAFGIYASVNSVVSKSKIKTDQKISIFAFAVLGNLVLVTAIFSASTASVSVSVVQEIARLHMRYYDFALPLLVVIVASQLSPESIVGIRKWRAVVAFPIGASILYALYTQLSPYAPNSVDSPEIRGFISN